MKSIIEVKNLVKKYGKFTAVDGVSFDVYEGETFGILGPNGAGKTTTLEIIEGLRKPTSGTAIIDGVDVAKDPGEVKARIGVQLQSSSFFDNLNLRELLDTFGSLYNRKVDPDKLIAQVQLKEKENNLVKELSGGQKQRFSIASALVNDPRVVFLDEPTTGLDPQARHNLWELVRQVKAEGKTIVLTTHYMEEAEVLCDRIAVMDHGKIVALDTTENLLKSVGNTTRISFEAGNSEKLPDLKQVQNVQTVETIRGRVVLVTDDVEKTLPSLFKLEHESNFGIHNLQVQQPTLEDVFLKLTGHSLRD